MGIVWEDSGSWVMRNGRFAELNSEVDRAAFRWRRWRCVYKDKAGHREESDAPPAVKLAKETGPERSAGAGGTGRSPALEQQPRRSGDRGPAADQWYSVTQRPSVPVLDTDGRAHGHCRPGTRQSQRDLHRRYRPSHRVRRYQFLLEDHRSGLRRRRAQRPGEHLQPPPGRGRCAKQSQRSRRQRSPGGDPQ